ncbi:MAG TPA: GDP-L-fucose synthase [Xanthobacteraceae bacterium]|nr:GDP-L-fucose synthase [Xanthobacteraceae bacterium]
MSGNESFSLDGRRVFVAGHRGMVGSAIVRRLGRENCEVLTAPRNELDLLRQADTERWIHAQKPDVVVLAAARVGGIAFNAAKPVEFLAENLAIELNVIQAAYAAGVRKLLFLGSSCVYPKFAPQPMQESALLTGSLEPTNQWYAVAKIAGLKLVEAYREEYGADFVSVMPTNLYGPGDNYHPEHSHVPAALIRRFHEAKFANAPTVTVWGTGSPRREFLAVDDLADACVFVLKNYSGAEFVNVGTGKDISIAEFAQLVADVIGYKGRIAYDTSRPDGTPQKLLDVSKLTQMGWRASIGLREGLAAAYADFQANREDILVREKAAS